MFLCDGFSQIAWSKLPMTINTRATSARRSVIPQSCAWHDTQQTAIYTYLYIYICICIYVYMYVYAYVYAYT